jgi:hypothetical protein
MVFSSFVFYEKSTETTRRVLYNRRNHPNLPPFLTYNTTMWKIIQEKLQASVLAYWSQVLWCVIGLVMGMFLVSKGCASEVVQVVAPAEAPAEG